MRTFDDFLSLTEKYAEAVHDAGDLLWHEDPERRAKVAAQLGLPADTPALELRRALFERGRR